MQPEFWNSLKSTKTKNSQRARTLIQQDNNSPYIWVQLDHEKVFTWLMSSKRDKLTDRPPHHTKSSGSCPKYMGTEHKEIFDSRTRNANNLEQRKSLKLIWEKYFSRLQEGRGQVAWIARHRPQLYGEEIKPASLFAMPADSTKNYIM